MTDNNIMKLSDSRLLTKNVLFFLLPQGVGVLSAIVCIPILIKELGTDKFGVMTIAWIIVGYFSMLDLGIGRTITRLISEFLGSQKKKKFLFYYGLL